MGVEVLVLEQLGISPLLNFKNKYNEHTLLWECPMGFLEQKKTYGMIPIQDPFCDFIFSLLFLL